MSKKRTLWNILRLLRLFVKDIPIGACTYVFRMCFIVTGAHFLRQSISISVSCWCVCARCFFSFRFFYFIVNFSHNCGFVTSAKLCHNTTHNRDRNIKHPFMLMDSIINHEKWNTINFLRLHKHCCERVGWRMDRSPPDQRKKKQLYGIRIVFRQVQFGSKQLVCAMELD